MAENASASHGSNAAAQQADEPGTSPARAADASEGSVGGLGDAAAEQAAPAGAAAAEANADGVQLPPQPSSALLPDPDDDGLSFSYDGEEMEELEEEEVQQVRLCI